MTKPDYKNWMPKGMVLGTLAGAVGCLGLAAVCGCTPLLNGKAKCGLTAAFLLSGAAAGAAALWMGRMYRAFSYDGDRRSSRGSPPWSTSPRAGSDWTSAAAAVP